MILQINTYHGTYNRSARGGNSIQYIVIHYTAGTGSARNNCIYFSGGNRNASADYFVDDSGIWEYNDPGSGYYTWAVGDGGGRYGITNRNSCSIEVVNTGGPFSNAEIAHLKELVPHLMKRFGVPASRVVRHYDASRKQCPYYYVNQDRWNELHAAITGSSAPATVTGGSTSTAPVTNNAPASNGSIAVDGYWGTGTMRKLQQVLGTPADGVASGQSRDDFKKANRGGLVTSAWKMGDGGSMVIKEMQRRIGTTADGYFGPNTCRALQAYLGTYQDGYVSGPSTMVKALQRRLNENRF